MRPHEKGPWRKGNRQAARGEYRLPDTQETRDEKIDRLAWEVLAEAAALLGPDVYRPVAARGGRCDR